MILQMKKKYAHDGAPGVNGLTEVVFNYPYPRLPPIPPSVVLYRELRNDGAGITKPKSFKHTAFEHRLRIAVHSICLNKSSGGLPRVKSADWSRNFPFRKTHLRNPRALDKISH